MRGKGSTIVTIAIALFLVLAVLSPVCHSAGDVEEEVAGFPAGWSDDINMSDSTSTFDQEQAITSEDDNVHLVWNHDSVDINYKSSNNGGITWSQTKTIYNSNFLSRNPDIAVSGQNVHMVVNDYEGWNGNYYRNSTDGGNTWNPIKRITQDGMDCYGPRIYVNDSNVHIIWYDVRDGSNGEIYYRRSLDGGITWDNGQGVDEDRRITFSPSTIGGIQIAGDGSNISVTWIDERDGDFEIYWMISKDNGFTWEDGLGTPNADRKLSDSTSWSVGPMISVNRSNIHIVWHDEIWPGPVYNLYYRNSIDNGFTWTPTQLLCGPNPLSYGADVEVQGDIVWIMYGDNKDSTYELFYQNSTDGGTTWGLDTRITEVDGYYSMVPRFCLNGITVHVSFTDTRNGLEEIYYKRYPDFPIDTAPPLLFHNPVISANGRLPVPIFVNVTDNGSGGVDNVTLFYKNIGDAIFSNTSMMLDLGNQWNGTWLGDIPKQNQAGLLSYYINATDHSTNSNQTIEYQIDVYDWPWPNVTAISPMKNETNVSMATPVIITFSEPMYVSSVETSFSYSNGTTEWTSLNGSWNWDASNTVGAFTLNDFLQNNTDYYICLNSTIAKESEGHYLDGNGDNEWSPPETWVDAEDMLGFGKSGFGSTVLNGKLYAIGGEGNPPKPSVEVYDTVNDSWNTVSPLNIGRTYTTANVCNGKIYVVAGKGAAGSYIGEIEEYDPIGDKWTIKASLQLPRFGHSAAVYEDKIYIFGGWNGAPMTSVEVYDTTLNITYEYSNLPFARRYSAAVTYSDNIYIAGGTEGGIFRTLEKFNPITTEWTSLQNMYLPRYGLQLNVLNDRLYAMGGRDPTFNRCAKNERYNPFTDEWTNVTDMPTPKEMFGSGVVGGKIFTFGSLWGALTQPINEVFIPDDDFHSSFTTGEPFQMNITLDQGWNLISLPLEQSNESIDQVLNSITGKWDYVQAYDPLAPEPWKTYATFKPNQLNELQSLNHKMGFWINIIEPNVNLTVRGHLPVITSINLYAGWNLIGYPTMSPEIVANALWGTGADKVEVFDPAEPYRIKEVGPTYLMKPGEGYWVHVPADTVWVVDW